MVRHDKAINDRIMRVTGYTLALLMFFTTYAMGQNSVAQSCELQVWSVTTYTNFKMTDSTVVKSGHYKDIYYYGISDVYEQFQWNNKLLTVYKESNLVTVVPVDRPVDAPQSVKIKKRNQLPDSLIEQLDQLSMSDSISDYTQETKDGFKYIKYKVNKERVSLKINLNSNQVEEYTVTRYIRQRDGKVNVVRQVTKLNEITRDLSSVGIVINPNKVVVEEGHQLTEEFSRKGFSLFEL